MRTALFAYNFAHKKTEDFLVRLCLTGNLPEIVVASPPVRLDLPKTVLKDKYRHIGTLSPEEICGRLQVPYLETAHEDKTLPLILKEKGIEAGIIAGARILKNYLIESLPKGIINFHPGLIPENRGLNAVKWAVALDVQQGMTVHLINNRVDHGEIIDRYIVPVFSHDTIRDINERITELQTAVLPASLEKVGGAMGGFGQVDGDYGYHPPADESIDKKVMSSFKSYLKKWAVDENGHLCMCRNPLTKDMICGKCGRKYTILEINGLKILKETVPSKG